MTIQEDVERALVDARCGPRCQQAHEVHWKALGQLQHTLQRYEESLKEVRAVAAGTKDSGDPDETYAMLDHIEGIARQALSTIEEVGKA